MNYEDNPQPADHEVMPWLVTAFIALLITIFLIFS